MRQDTYTPGLEEFGMVFRRRMFAYGIPIAAGIFATGTIVLTILYLSSEIINFRMHELEQSLQKSSQENFFSITSGLYSEISLVVSKIAAGGEDETTDRSEARARIAQLFKEEEVEFHHPGLRTRAAQSAIRAVRYLMGKQTGPAADVHSRSPVLLTAYSLERSRDYRGAIEEYERALREESSLQAEIMLHQAFCHSMLGNHTKALGILAMVRMLHPGSEQAQLAMALYQKVEELERITLESTTGPHPEAPSIQSARKLFVRRRFTEAMKQMAVLLKQAGADSMEIRFLIARSHEELGKNKVAIGTYKDILEKKGAVSVSDRKWISRAQVRLAILEPSPAQRRYAAATSSAAGNTTGSIGAEAIQQTLTVFRTASSKGATPVSYYLGSSDRLPQSNARTQPFINKGETEQLASYFQSARDSVLRRNEQIATRTTAREHQPDAIVRRQESKVENGATEKIFKVISSGVEYRSSPARSSRITGMLDPMRPAVLEEQKNGWLKLRLADGKRVWVEERFRISRAQLGKSEILGNAAEQKPQQAYLIVTRDSVSLLTHSNGIRKMVGLYAGERVTLLRQADTLMFVRTENGVTGWTSSQGLARYDVYDHQTRQSLIKQGRTLRERAQQTQKQHDKELRERLAPLIAAARNKNEIERVLSRSGGLFMKRYEDRLKKMPSLRGTIRVGFLIRPEGTADSISIISSTLRDTIFENEVRGLMTTVQFKPLPEQTDPTYHEYVFPFVPVIKE